MKSGGAHAQFPADFSAQPQPAEEFEQYQFCYPLETQRNSHKIRSLI